MHVDLHTHTTASDGKLTPAELVERAALAGVELLAITDHDTTAAYADLPAGGPPAIVAGVEFSTHWRRIGVHVVGLHVRLDDDALRSGVDAQRRARAERAVRIAAALEKLGIENPLAGARALAGSGVIGRAHFARHLVATGVVKSFEQAFSRYLGGGRPGDIHEDWAGLAEVIGWIRAAGGTAVLAHPAKYKLRSPALRALTAEFRAAGGQAIEIISGKQDPQVTQRLAELCAHHRLLASCGSDFHEPGQPWAEIGVHADLPRECRPVWEGW